MRRGGSRYVREDATSSVQLAGVMLGTGLPPRQVHREQAATAATPRRGPEIICPPENNRVAYGRPTSERPVPYRPSTAPRHTVSAYLYLLTYLRPRKQQLERMREKHSILEYRYYLAILHLQSIFHDYSHPSLFS